MRRGSGQDGRSADRGRPAWVTIPLALFGTVLVAVTLLPLVPTNEGWVRVWDFPRLQIACLLALTALGAAALLDPDRARVQLFLSTLLVCLSYQAWRLLPYSPLVPVEVGQAQHCDAAHRVSMLVANVHKDNRRLRPLLDLIRATDPDLILAIETDGWWHRELAVLASEYPHAVHYPQENAFGMALYARLELVAPEVRFLLEDYVPSIRTAVRLRSGALIDVHGVHPKPPLIGQDTDRRDAELLIVGREVRRAPRPAIVAGDLNDVAWSRTTTLFQEISGLLDPRIGRGLYPTYPVGVPLLIWPIDQVFVEPSFLVVALRRLGDIGSDHFPIFIDLCHRPRAARRQEAPAPDLGDRGAAREAIEEGRTDGTATPAPP